MRGMTLLEAYLEHRAPSAHSCLGNAGSGGSGRPTSDHNQATMMALTIGICIDKCPWYMRGFAFRGNVLQFWVALVTGSTGYRHRVPTIDQLERSLPFTKALAWLETEMADRLRKEKEHHASL